MNIWENVLIELQDDDGKVATTIRALWIDPSVTDVVTIDINNPNAFPVWQKSREIEAAFVEQKARLLKTDPFTHLYRPEDSIPQDHRRRRDEVWEIIAPIVESGVKVFFPSERGILVKEAIERTGSTKPTIYKYLRWYWQGGQKPNALLPRYDNCGGKGKERKIAKKLGRPRKHTQLKGKHPGINVTEQIRIIIVKSAEKFHEKQRKTLKDSYQAMLEKSFSQKVKDRDGVEVPILWAAERCPTLRQFCYHYYKDRDLRRSLISREGQRWFNLHYREVTGDSTQMAPFPGALWQIDSTIVDIHLVSSLDRSRIIGRPVLYLVVDLFSRMIVGFSVSLEGPSWLGASLALENATTDKVKFCQEFGITITADEWSHQHLSKRLQTDRGSEYLSGNAREALKTLNIEFSPTPAYRPDWKGVVERLFRLINDEVIHWEPGAVYKPRERGDKDYRFESIYTLDEFRQIMIRLILYYNNYYWLENYPLTKDMIEDHVKPCPCELWEWGIRNYGRPRQETQEIIRLNLLHRGEATVTRRGICFRANQVDFHDRLRYSCETAVREQWFINAGLNGSWKVPIAYDPRKPQVIYRLIDGGKNMEPCELLPASKSFSECNLEEVMDHFVEHNFAQQNAQPIQRQGKATLNAYLDQYRSEAQEKTESARSGESKSSLAQGIRENRKALRDYEREKNAWDLRTEEASDQARKVIPLQADSQRENDDESYVPAPQETEILDEIFGEIWNNGQQ